MKNNITNKNSNSVKIKNKSSSIKNINNLKVLKFISYNIKGIANKTSFPDFFQYIESADVFALYETHLESSNLKKMGKYFNNFNLQWRFAGRTSIFGRGIGGCLLGFKKSLSNEGVTVNFKSCEEIDQIEIKVGVMYFNVLPLYMRRASWIEQFNELKAFINEKQLKNVMIMGDLNIRIGELSQNLGIVHENCSEFRKSKDKQVDKNGRDFLNFCTDIGLRILNGSHNGDKNGEFTFCSTVGNSVNDICAISTDMVPNVDLFRVRTNPWSDHFPLETLITFQTSSSSKILNLLPKLKWNPNNKIHYQNALNTNLISHVSEYNGNLRLDNFAEIVSNSTSCSKNCLKFTKKEKWYDSSCERARRLSFQSLNIYRRSGLPCDKTAYLLKNEKFSDLCDIKEKEYINELERKLDTVRDSKSWWNIVKEIRNESFPLGLNINIHDFQNYFQTLLNPPVLSADFSYAAPFYNIRQLDKEIELHELKIVLNNLKLNKAPGENRIPYEFYINATDNFLEQLAKVYTKILNGEFLEDSFSKSIIFPIHKKGDVNDVRNYRGISFMDCDVKLFLNVVNNRLTTWVEENNILNEFQAGFRKGYSTSDNIYNLTSIVHLKFKKKEKVYAFFVDFKAAFDTVSRKSLIYKLFNLGISFKLVKLIEALYTKTSSSVWSGSALSDSFTTESGVKQGCPLSPLLFALYLNDIHDSLDDGIRIGSKEIKVLMYADDIVLLSNTPVKLRKMITSLEKYCELWNLTVNLSKSKILVFRKGGVVPKTLPFLYKNQEIEIVNSYCYLGVLLNYQLSWAENINDRISKAKYSVNCTWNDFLSRNQISMEAKFKVFVAVCIAILSYAAQVWGFTGFEEIDKFQRYFLKRILNLPDNTPNYLLNFELNLVNCHYFTLKLHMDYIFRTLFILEEHRLPKFLSLQILKENIFWAKEWNDLGNRFEVEWNINNLDRDVWKSNYEHLYNMLVAEDNNFFVTSIENSERIYKELYKTDINSYINLNDRSKIMWIFKARTDLIVLNGTRFTGREQQACSLCDREIENTEHFIARCPFLAEIRRIYFGSSVLEHSKFLDVLNGKDDENWNNLHLFLKEAIIYRKDCISDINS